jgi:hypothetical protein
MSKEQVKAQQSQLAAQLAVSYTVKNIPARSDQCKVNMTAPAIWKSGGYSCLID